MHPPPSPPTPRSASYEVRRKRPKQSDMTADIVDMLATRFAPGGRLQCGIVYALSRNDCERVAADLGAALGARLGRSRARVGHYHASMTAEERERVQTGERFFFVAGGTPLLQGSQRAHTSPTTPDPRLDARPPARHRGHCRLRHGHQQGRRRVENAVGTLREGRRSPNAGHLSPLAYPASRPTHHPSLFGRPTFALWSTTPCPNRWKATTRRLAALGETARPHTASYFTRTPTRCARAT